MFAFVDKHNLKCQGKTNIICPCLWKKSYNIYHVDISVPRIWEYQYVEFTELVLVGCWKANGNRGLYISTSGQDKSRPMPYMGAICPLTVALLWKPQEQIVYWTAMCSVKWPFSLISFSPAVWHSTNASSLCVFFLALWNSNLRWITKVLGALLIRLSLLEYFNEEIFKLFLKKILRILPFRWGPILHILSWFWRS
jgi:hypothetical protein